jgi:hypothetical protein
MSVVWTINFSTDGGGMLAKMFLRPIISNYQNLECLVFGVAKAVAKGLALGM